MNPDRDRPAMNAEHRSQPEPGGEPAREAAVDRRVLVDARAAIRSASPARWRSSIGAGDRIGASPIPVSTSLVTGCASTNLTSASASCCIGRHWHLSRNPLSQATLNRRAPMRALGRTGVEVTVFGYGTMELRGEMRGPMLADADAARLLNAVLDESITLIDTSIDYAAARS
jgi:hypothetical protein